MLNGPSVPTEAGDRRTIRHDPCVRSTMGTGPRMWLRRPRGSPDREEHVGGPARAPRVRVPVPIRLIEGDTTRMILAEGEDISTTGLFVRCDEPFVVGTRVRAEISIEGATIEVMGRVVRIGQGSSGRTGMGIMFAEQDGRTAAAIERLVSERRMSADAHR